MDRLEVLRAKLEREHNDRLKRDYQTLPHESASIKMGKKYAKVDIGGSGKYMVELATGMIFGIKGYGVIHRGHQYGTLETIEDYNWGGYTAIRRELVKT